MKEWWHRKKERMRKNQKTDGMYTFGDFIFRRAPLDTRVDNITI